MGNCAVCDGEATEFDSVPFDCRGFGLSEELKHLDWRVVNRDIEWAEFQYDSNPRHLHKLARFPSERSSGERALTHRGASGRA